MNETLFLPAGDSAVNVEFGRTIDPEINKKIRGLSDSLSRKPIRGVTECIPTFRSLLVCYDPLQTGCEALIKKLKKRIKSLDQVSGGEKRVFNIPVCYGGEFGEDIAFVASHAGLTEQEVIDIHTAEIILSSCSDSCLALPISAIWTNAAYSAPVKPTNKYSCGLRRHRRRADRNISARVSGRLAAYRQNAR